MAWIYLAESAESASHSNHGCKQSHIVKETPMHKQSYSHEWPIEASIKPLSGTTLEALHQECFQESTSSSVDSPVRTSALQALEKAWKASEVVYSTKLSGLQKKLERRLCSSKTSQQLELADFLQSSEHLPKSGMTVGGHVFLPQALEPLTSANDGSYLPTPTASTAGTNGKHKCKQTGKWINGTPSLSTMASQNLWPTPQARDWKDGLNPTKHGRHSDSMAVVVHSLGFKGYLNPQFVEVLMGFPTGWTELSALATQWFQSKRKKRSSGLQVSNEGAA